jgi:hypothetical protein
MALIKKRDLADRYAAGRRLGTQIRVFPQIQPDARSFPKKEPSLADSKPTEFQQDFTADHSSPDLPLKLPSNSAHGKDQQVRAVIRRVEE